MRAKAQSVEEYISAQPEEAAATLRRLRSIVRSALPQAEETISYGMPAYKLHGKIILCFAGWKRHYSLYPAGPRLVAAFREELAGYEVDKSTIRFPLTQPLPAKLIAHIAMFRLAEVAERNRS